jgi:hypothetical protein
MEVSIQLQAHVLRPGKSPRYPLDRKLGGPQVQSARCGEKKIFLVPGIEPRSSSRGPSRYTDWAVSTPS